MKKGNIVRVSDKLGNFIEVTYQNRLIYTNCKGEELRSLLRKSPFFKGNCSPITEKQMQINNALKELRKSMIN